MTQLLKTERQRVLALQHDLRMQEMAARSSEDYNVMISDLMAEKTLLLQENKRLTSAIVSIRNDTRSEYESRLSGMEEELRRVTDTRYNDSRIKFEMTNTTMQQSVMSEPPPTPPPVKSVAKPAVPIQQVPAVPAVPTVPTPIIRTVVKCDNCAVLMKEIEDLKITNSDCKQVSNLVVF